jgi:hypothetical protein
LQVCVNTVQKSKNHCGANDLSVTVISNNVMKIVRYLHHNGFLFFEQRLHVLLKSGNKWILIAKIIKCKKGKKYAAAVTY